MDGELPRCYAKLWIVRMEIDKLIRVEINNESRW